ncbi:MAG: hypothetical protein O3B72_08180, partial [Proteobacteria bacterium]|nr:hypothetical protein [Pseudomonadota bacterium]
MYVDSLSKVLLTCVVTLALTACGGGGGGGGGSLIGDGAGGSSSGGTSSGGISSTGTITLSISGLVDANGEPDNVLAGNETATLTAEVTENGSAAELVVLFDATIGQLVQSSAQSTDGTAQVQIRGTGEAGASTVTASTTLSDGTEISTTLIVQTSASAPTIAILDASNNPVDTVELRAADSAALKARLTDWDGSPLSGIGVS